jgi:hypothetical protein
MSISGRDNRGLLKTIPQETEYPDPVTLPAQPSWQQPRLQLTLAELIPGKYVAATARIVYLKTSERRDALGNKLVFSGLLEDSTFKVPFVSHRISYPLIRNSVYKFYSAYVHEFGDKSVLLIITEHTKIEPKNIEDYREFVWVPKIESIERPVQHIALQGVITTIHSNSGLVKRCDKCKSILYDSCPNKCNEGWGWDLRVSSRLYDGTGSIKTVLTKDIASRVLQKNLGELILLANQPIQSNTTNQFQTTICKIKIPDGIEITEAVSENVSSYRKSGKLIVTDGRNLVFLPTNEEHNFTDFLTRELRTSDPGDRKIIRRLIEKALEISIKRVTGKKLMHGIFLLEDPILLYRGERARLYLGFSIRANLTEKEDGRVEEAVIELAPQAYTRESILDYVNLRRERGASANAIARNLTMYRNRVIVAPSGNYGSITEVIMRKAGNQKVSDTDNRNLVEFWKQIYDIDISPDEIPLLKIKMVDSENTFTYPPSMCFFAGGDFIPAGVQKFIESKKSTLKVRMDDVVKAAIQDLRIGDLRLRSEAAITEQKTDIQAQLLQETRQKLFGRNVSARGSVMNVYDELWFFPSQLQLS